MKILNFGSLNIDYVYQVDHMVRAGETLSSADMEPFLGGKGFNQSVALAKAGVSVYHAGMIGEDGEIFRDVCRQYGIHTDYIKTGKGKNGHAIIQIDQTAQNCILLYGGSNQQITREYADEVLSHFDKGDYILLQNEISELGYIIDKAYEIGMKIILNPSPFDVHIEKCELRKVFCFLLNEVEGNQMTGETEPELIAEKILLRYPEAKVVLTLGKNGSAYFDKENSFTQEIYAVKAVDTTAAGDTFTGYFIMGLLTGLSIGDNLKMCAVASGITVSRKGASTSIPTKQEVEDQLQNSQW